MDFGSPPHRTELHTLSPLFPSTFPPHHHSMPSLICRFASSLFCVLSFSFLSFFYIIYIHPEAAHWHEEPRRSLGCNCEDSEVSSTSDEIVTTASGRKSSETFLLQISTNMSYWYYRYREEREENRDLSRQISRLRYNVQELGRQRTRLYNENSELSSQVSTLRSKAWGLEREKTRMFSENSELRSQVSALSSDLAKQREDTRKAGLLFMDAADAYQQAAKKQIKAKVAELEDARKASMMIMDAADAYQDVAKKKTKAKEEELEDMRKAILVLMTAADAYQQEAKKQIKEMGEELKSLGAQKAEMDARAESLEAKLDAALYKAREMEVGHDKVKVENGNLRSEVERLMMELGKLAEAGEAAAKASDVEKIEITDELEDLNKMKVDETQDSKDLTKVNKLPSEVLIAKQND